MGMPELNPVGKWRSTGLLSGIPEDDQLFLCGIFELSESYIEEKGYNLRDDFDIFIFPCLRRVYDLNRHKIFNPKQLCDFVFQILGEWIEMLRPIDLKWKWDKEIYFAKQVSKLFWNDFVCENPTRRILFEKSDDFTRKFILLHNIVKIE